MPVARAARKSRAARRFELVPWYALAYLGDAMQDSTSTMTIGTEAGSRAGYTAQLSPRAAAIRARIANEKTAPEDPAREESRRARRAGINPRRMARVVNRLRALGFASAERLRAKREGTARAFGARFVPEYAEEFASGALCAWSIGAGRRATLRAGYDAGNATLRKMSHEAGAEILLSLPAEVIEHEEHEDTARMLAETRRAILLRAVELRAKARAAYDIDARAASAKTGRARNVALIAARRAFARDSRFIRRGALVMLARLYGRGFEFAPALGVSPEGRRGGKARGALNQWARMLAQHEATRARLGV